MKPIRIDSPSVRPPSDGYCRAAWNAVCRSQAVVEFDMDGTITWANGRFLDLVGYRMDELIGRHHPLLCPEEYAASTEYALFWEALRAGEFENGAFSRRRADGSEIWLQATYNPIFDAAGTAQRVLKIATDVTRQVMLERALQRNDVDLRTAMDGLSEIVRVISSIAGQTNLLALNATIEAARRRRRGSRLLRGRSRGEEARGGHQGGDRAGDRTPAAGSTGGPRCLDRPATWRRGATSPLFARRAVEVRFPARVTPANPAVGSV